MIGFEAQEGEEWTINLIVCHWWKFNISEIFSFWNVNLKTYSMPTKYLLIILSFSGQFYIDELKTKLEELIAAILICQIQDFEADFLSRVTLKILKSGLILKMFTW